MNDPEEVTLLRLRVEQLEQQVLDLTAAVGCLSRGGLAIESAMRAVSQVVERVVMERRQR